MIPPAAGIFTPGAGGNPDEIECGCIAAAVEICETKRLFPNRISMFDMRTLHAAPLFACATWLLVACSGANGTDGDDGGGAERAEPTLPVQAVEVQPRDLSRTVNVSGPVEPLRNIRLASRTDGVVEEVLVEEGDRVARGEVIARLDVSEQRAELARAQARVEEKALNFERMQRLRDQNYVDAAAFEAAQAELAVARSDEQLWQTRVDFGVVRASANATVIARHIEPGEAVARHDPMFELADLANLVVRLGVSELDVRRLEVGSIASIRLDAVADLNPVEGRVRRIFPSAETDSRLVQVEIELPDAAVMGVRPGFLARAHLVVDERAGVLAVPSAAIAEREDGGYYVMRINDEDRLERRAVEGGVTRGGWLEIRDGLGRGDRVVATNPLDLSEGARVRIVGWAG